MRVPTEFIANLPKDSANVLFHDVEKVSHTFLARTFRNFNPFSHYSGLWLGQARKGAS